MERKIYVVQNYDTRMEKLVKLTKEQAEAIDWLFNTFEVTEFDIEDLDDKIDIDEP